MKYQDAKRGGGFGGPAEREQVGKIAISGEFGHIGGLARSEANASTGGMAVW